MWVCALSVWSPKKLPLRLSMMLSGMEYPFGQPRLAAQAVSAQILAYTILLIEGSGQTKKKRKPLCCARTAQQQPEHCLRHKSETQHHVGCCEEN